MMNKSIIIGAIIAAIAIGVIVGIIGSGMLSTTSTQKEVIKETTERTTTPVTPTKLSGSIVIDGSSTVYPLTEYIAEKFSKTYPDVKVTVGISGTGGGFKRFIVGETDINDSSRPITDKEIATAKENNIKWVEIPVALEGLTIVVNKDNNLLDCISISELKEIWKPDSTIKRWSDIKSTYPNEEIRLYGAGPDSGTFDYFTERVVGKARESRIDYIPSEDDNVLVQGVVDDKYALGYIPMAYALTSTDRLKILRVSDGGECVYPATESVIDGSYPLSRPLFIHSNYDKLRNSELLQKFVEFYLNNAKEGATSVGYIPLSDSYYQEALKVFKEGKYSENDKVTFNTISKKS